LSHMLTRHAVTADDRRAVVGQEYGPH
jgi:hypothetical protein